MTQNQILHKYDDADSDSESDRHYLKFYLTFLNKHKISYANGVHLAKFSCLN